MDMEGAHEWNITEAFWCYRDLDYQLKYISASKVYLSNAL